MADDDFEPHYWLGRMYADQPGHTSWEGSEDVTGDLADARDALNSDAPASERIEEATGILDALLDDTPADTADDDGGAA